MQRQRRGEEQDNEILNLGINQFRAFSLACITEKIHFDKMSTYLEYTLSLKERTEKHC